jgi:dihydrofolate reductase
MSHALRPGRPIPLPRHGRARYPAALPEVSPMAKLVYQMSQSLDGYVDHLKMEPGPALFRYFVDQARGLSGSLYGRRVYELMRYWEEDDPGWSDDEHAFAEAWRRLPKWVVSGTLTSLGPNATRIAGDLGTAVRALKTQREGRIEVAGPTLAQGLTELGLIDEYRLCLRPSVLGGDTPYFAGPRPPLRFVSSDRIGEDAVRLTYVPA